MLIMIVGSGRVGSAVAKRALDAGHQVSVLDSDPLSHERLDKDQTTTWEDAGGRFTVGAALEIDALIEAGIDQAEVFMAATSGDNTNLVIAQIAQRRFNVPRVVVRVADPGRAAKPDVRQADAGDLGGLHHPTALLRDEIPQVRRGETERVIPRELGLPDRTRSGLCVLSPVRISA